jgi:hypothetical protein
MISRLRSELVVCGLLSGVVALFGIAIAVSLPNLGREPLPERLSELIPYVREAFFVVPILTGIIVGTSLTAAEFDVGTSVFVWSIAANRTRWFLETAGVGLMLVAVCWAPIGIAEHILSQRLGPQLDAQLSPMGLDSSAMLMLSRALLTFAVVCVIGMVSGRTIPTVLLGAIASILLLAVLETAFFAWRDVQVEPVDPTLAGTLPVGSRVATLDGRLVGDQEARSALSLEETQFVDRYEWVLVGLSPVAHAETDAEEFAVFGAATLTLLALTSRIAESRRP